MLHCSTHGRQCFRWWHRAQTFLLTRKQTTILAKSNGTLGLFWQFSHFPPPPPPPPLHTMLDQLAQGVPREATLYGGEGGGPSLGKRAAFIIEQGQIMKTKQIFKVYHILLTRIVASPVHKGRCPETDIIRGNKEIPPPCCKKSGTSLRSGLETQQWSPKHFWRNLVAQWSSMRDKGTPKHSQTFVQMWTVSLNSSQSWPVWTT